MTTPSLAILGVIATAGLAHGGEAPLLVSVEVAPGLDVSPAEVRRMIAIELGTPRVRGKARAAPSAHRGPPPAGARAARGRGPVRAA
jgi:hypothetical protein